MLEFEKKIDDMSAKIGIVGLGYVGIPLALAFAEKGFKVLGFDVQSGRVDSVNRGNSYIVGIANDRLSKVIGENLLEATTEKQRLKEVDAICICVPTPLTRTKEPDLSYVVSESECISDNLQSGQLIILESTTYPGTTKTVMLPILERSGLTVGKDFFLAYSPERIDPGNVKYNIWNTPKVVGGIDSTSTKLAECLYGQIVKEVFCVSSLEIAEMTKLFENVFRSVNIALVNELAQLCEKMGISVWEVIGAAATKPFGFLSFYPGPGIGGHCIPLDPYFLASKARELDFHTRFIELAAEINDYMQEHVALRIMGALNERRKTLNGAEILLLGVAYKKDVADWRESPSVKLIQSLRKGGAKVSYNDSYVPTINTDQGEMTSVELNDNTLASADCVVIAVDHSYYDIKKITTLSKLVFDSRGATRGRDGHNIVRLGE